MSPNAFKAVLDTDTLGTFNMCRVLYEKFFRVSGLWLGTPASGHPLTALLVCCRTTVG